MKSDKALLADVCDISMGQAPSGDTYNTSGKGLPLIAGAGDFGGLTPEASKFTTSPTRISRPGDIILCIRATIGDRNWSDAEYCLGRGVAGLLGNAKKLDQRYLWHWLGHVSPQLKAKGRGATFLQVNKADIGSLEIPLPTLEEQRRIAAILDKADALSAKRRGAIALLDKLLHAAFTATFGDPASNSKGWPLVQLANYGEISTGNTPSRAASENYGLGIEWIKSDNLNHEGDYVTESEERLSAIGEEKARIVPHGSILVTCIAGSFNCIGNLAITDRRVAFNQQINAIVPKESPTEFVYYLLKAGKALIQAASTKSMKGMVSKSKFCAIKVPKPPLALQRDFVVQFNSISEVKRSMCQAALLQETIFNGLQQRAFSGAL